MSMGKGIRLVLMYAAGMVILPIVAFSGLMSWLVWPDIVSFHQAEDREKQSIQQSLAAHNVPGGWFVAAPDLPYCGVASAYTVANGDALIVGSEGPLLFNPSTNKFSQAAGGTKQKFVYRTDGAMTLNGYELSAPLTQRAIQSYASQQGLLKQRYTTAILLATGKLLIAGGDTTGTTPGCFALHCRATTNQAVLYDCQSGKTAATGKLVTPRANFAATLLKDGNVMLFGGEQPALVKRDPDDSIILSSTEIYDVRTGKFRSGPSMRVPRTKPAAITLGDGRILIVGGLTTRPNAFTETAEIYDPHTNMFGQPLKMSTWRLAPHILAVTLKSGRVLLMGQGCFASGACDVFDPATSTFSPKQLVLPRIWSGAVCLIDGRVLVVGGQKKLRVLSGDHQECAQFCEFFIDRPLK
jgi:hypothetical protein